MDNKKLVTTIHSIVQSCAQSCLNEKLYDEKMIPDWGETIIKDILTKVNEITEGKFKIVANCMLLSLNNQHINESQMALWDETVDMKIFTKWANETLQCIVSVWAFRNDI